MSDCGLDRLGAEQAVEYVRAGARALGAMPSDRHGGRGAILRRSRRHADGDACAVRVAHQSGLGTGAAQALLPHVQFRAAGGRDGQRDGAFVERSAFVSAGGGLQLSAAGYGDASVDAMRCWRLPCSARAGNGMRRGRWRCRVFWAGVKCRRRFSACARTTCWPAVFPDQAACAENLDRRDSHSGSSAGERDHRQLPA